MFHRHKLHCLLQLKHNKMFFPSPPLHHPESLVLHLHYQMYEQTRNVKVYTPFRLDFVCLPWWEFILIGFYLEFNSLWEGMRYLVFQGSVLQALTISLAIFCNPYTNIFLRQTLNYSLGRSCCFITSVSRREGVWDFPSCMFLLWLGDFWPT